MLFRSLAAAAEHVLAEADTAGGICLVYGLETGRLAEAIAAAGRMRVVCVDEDAVRVEAVRTRLREAGSYGERITALAVPALADLPFPDAFANLVVSERAHVAGPPPGSVHEALRVLRPCGGLLLIGGSGDDNLQGTVTVNRLEGGPGDDVLDERAAPPRTRDALQRSKQARVIARTASCM